MFNENQTSFLLWGEFQPKEEKNIIKDIIIDRKSKYTIVVFKVNSKDDIKKCMNELLKDEYFRKATHNSYGFRIEENNSLLEWKNDDWETWAWMCILRELQRENAVNMLLIVTRYFWWIKLQNDRFKNVIDACKMFFKKQKEEI